MAFFATFAQNDVSVESDLKNYVPNGEVRVEIWDSIKTSPQLMELSLKFQEGAKNNYEWFVDYMAKYANKGKMPYHRNFGLTKKEYNELMDYFKKGIELVLTQYDTIKINKSDTLITFETKGKLDVLNFLKIYPTENKILLFEDTLKCLGKVFITTNTNAFKSEWTGYNWQTELPEDFDFNDLKRLETFSFKNYKVTIGKLKKDNVTFFIIKVGEINNGEKTIDYELPIIIR
jgi:hypothetical protein